MMAAYWAGGNCASHVLRGGSYRRGVHSSYSPVVIGSRLTPAFGFRVAREAGLMRPLYLLVGKPQRKFRPDQCVYRGVRM